MCLLLKICCHFVKPVERQSAPDAAEYTELGITRRDHPTPAHHSPPPNRTVCTSERLNENVDNNSPNRDPSCRNIPCLKSGVVQTGLVPEPLSRSLPRGVILSAGQCSAGTMSLPPRNEAYTQRVGAGRRALICTRLISRRSESTRTV